MSISGRKGFKSLRSLTICIAYVLTSEISDKGRTKVSNKVSERGRLSQLFLFQSSIFSVNIIL